MTTNPTISQLRAVRKWFLIHNNLGIELIHHQFEPPYAEHTPDGTGIWNYYIHIHEQHCPASLFSQLWLKSKITKVTPESRGFVSHNYYELPNLLNCDFAGGITSYRKQGYIKHHRSVELGCDYSHLWDHERSAPTIEVVFSDAISTANQIFTTISTYENP